MTIMLTAQLAFGLCLFPYFGLGQNLDSSEVRRKVGRGCGILTPIKYVHELPENGQELDACTIVLPSVHNVIKGKSWLKITSK